MASKKIQNSDLFESNLLKKTIAEFTALNKVLELTEKNIKDILAEQKRALTGKNNNNSKEYKEQAKAIKAVADAQKALINVEIAKKRLAKQTLDAEKRATDAKVKETQATTTQIKVGRDYFKNIEKINRQKQKQIALEKKAASATLKGANSTNKWSKAMGSFAFKFNTLGNLVGNGISQIGMFVARALKGTLDILLNFSKAQSEVAAVLGSSKGDIRDLTADAKRLGAATKFTATQVSQLQKEYAKLGFSKTEILAATEATLSLAAATDSELGRAAEVAGATLRGFGLNASQMTRITDVMASSFSKSALDLESFAESMKLVAPIARAANIPVETTTALLGKLADAGLKGSIGGTSLKNILIKLTDPASEISKQLGYTVKNSDDLFRAFDDLSDGTIDLGKAVGLTDKRSAAAFVTFVKGAKATKGLAKELNNATGAAKQMAETMQDNLSGDIDKATSAWEGFVLTIADGSGVISKIMRSTVQSFTSFFQQLSAMLEGGKKGLKAYANFVIDNLATIITFGASKFIPGVKKMVEALKFDTGDPFEKLKNDLTALTDKLGHEKTTIDSLNDAYVKLYKARTAQNLATEDGIAKAKLYAAAQGRVLNLIKAKNAVIEKENKETEGNNKGTKQKTIAIERLAEAEKELLLTDEKLRDVSKDIKKIETPFVYDVDTVITNLEKIQADEKKAIEARNADIIESANLLLAELEQVWEKEAKKKEDLLNKEIEQSKSHQDELKKLARQGVEDAQDNLAYEQKRQAQLELQKAKDAKKQQQAKLATEFLDIYLKHADEDPNTALTKTMRDIALIEGAVKGLSSLDEGIEDTSEARQHMQVNDGKGGFLAVLHPNERVVNATQNAMLKGISNEKLVEGNKWQNNAEILKKFESLESAVKNIERVGFDIDEVSGIVTKIISKQNTTIRNHKKYGTLFN